MQELEAGIEELSQSFLFFSNLLLEADVLVNDSRVTSALQKITQQCVTLAKQGCDDPTPKIAVDAEVKDTEFKTPDTSEIDLCSTTNIVHPESLFVLDNPLRPTSSALNQWSQLPLTPPYQDQSHLPFGTALYSSRLLFSANTQSSPSSPSLPRTTFIKSSINSGQEPLSHRLVRECFQNGYWLLVNTPNNFSTIEKIFGTPLSINERNRLISAFYRAWHDEVGTLLEQRTKVLNPLFTTREDFSQEQLARIARAWQFVTECEPGEWVDASGVQQIFQQEGVRTSGSDSARSSTRLPASPSDVNLTTFITCALVLIRLLDLIANMSTDLSQRCICVGLGPAFKRRDVEKAIHVANANGAQPFNVSN